MASFVASSTRTGIASARKPPNSAKCEREHDRDRQPARSPRTHDPVDRRLQPDGDDHRQRDQQQHLADRDDDRPDREDDRDAGGAGQADIEGRAAIKARTHATVGEILVDPGLGSAASWISSARSSAERSPSSPAAISSLTSDSISCCRCSLISSPMWPADCPGSASFTQGTRLMGGGSQCPGRQIRAGGRDRVAVGGWRLSSEVEARTSASSWLAFAWPAWSRTSRSVPGRPPRRSSPPA